VLRDAGDQDPDPQGRQRAGERRRGLRVVRR
jgi:hypothetical protein